MCTRVCDWCVLKCLSLTQSSIQIMVSKCACGCGAKVRLSGDHRRDCRRRELAAGRWCPRNDRSAGQTRIKRAENLKIDTRHNHVNNPKNNPKNSLIRKRALRTKNLKLVKDDPTILETKNTSAGTSAPLSVPTDNDWCTWQP